MSNLERMETNSSTGTPSMVDVSSTSDDDDIDALGAVAEEETEGQGLPKAKKGVCFGEVRVREHERILNRRVSGLYAELDLGWGHQSSKHLLVDDYEKKKMEEHHEKKKHRNQNHERLQVLAKYGYSPKDVLALEQQKKKAMEQRKKGIPQSIDEVPEPRAKPKVFHSLFSAVGLKKKNSD